MEVSVKSSNKEILASGSFTNFDKEDSTISLKKGKEGFDIKISFREEEPGFPPKLEVKHDKDQIKNLVTAHVILTNFKGPLPNGFAEPLAIGLFDNGDKIYLQLNIRKLGPKVDRYDINYTIYLEEKQK